MLLLFLDQSMIASQTICSTSCLCWLNKFHVFLHFNCASFTNSSLVSHQKKRCAILLSTARQRRQRHLKSNVFVCLLCLVLLKGTDIQVASISLRFTFSAAPTKQNIKVECNISQTQLLSNKELNTVNSSLHLNIQLCKN